MKVVQIVPGSGGTFYCQNCMRDSATIKALRRHGHDVMMVPMYLPMYTDEPDLASENPVFFGGVNVYLQQKSGLFRKTPRWLDQLLDARWILKLTARMAGSTSAAGMGEMTLSMIRGEDGNQGKELERLVTWLRDQEQPDVVHISSALLIGLVRAIRKALNVPVVCTLQDEDTWIDAIDPPYNERCWAAIRERAGEIDAFVAVSHHYRDIMIRRLSLPAERVHVVPIGVDLEGYEAAPLAMDPPVIGYLSKLTPSLGLGTLVDAFMALKQEPSLAALRLKATGGLVGNADKRFARKLQQKLAAAGMAGDVEFLPEFDRPNRLAFLKSLSVLSVPVATGEAFGSYIIEAGAAGVPVVQPRAGAFPELVEATGGGVIYDGEGAEPLAAALKSVLLDPDRARELGRRGRENVVAHFSVTSMADRLLAVYETVAGS